MNRNRRPVSQPSNMSNPTTSAAAAAASLAFAKKQQADAGLSAAAAAAALRSHTTTPTPVGDIYTKRMARRGSTSSFGSIASSILPLTQRPGSSLQQRPGSAMSRRGSNASMTERTFRSPSPGGRNNRLPFSGNVPATPSLPSQYSRRSGSLDNTIARVTSPTPSTGGRVAGPPRTGRPTLANVPEQQVLDTPTSRPSVNFSRPMSPDLMPTSAREGVRARPASSQGFYPVQNPRVQQQVQPFRPSGAAPRTQPNNSMPSKPILKTAGRSAVSTPFTNGSLPANPARMKPAAGTPSPTARTNGPPSQGRPASTVPRPFSRAGTNGNPTSTRPASTTTGPIMQPTTVPVQNSRTSATPTRTRPPVVTDGIPSQDTAQASSTNGVLPADAITVPSPTQEQMRVFQTRAAAFLTQSAPDGQTNGIVRPEEQQQQQQEQLREEPLPSQQTLRSATHAGTRLAPNTGTTGTANVQRTPSASPARSARFSEQPLLDIVRHQPAPRALSPAKSSLKPASIRTSSPDSSRQTGTDNSDTRSVKSMESTTKKKKARVNFEEQPEVIQAMPKGVSTSTKSMWMADQDGMGPRPALPTFGSVRGRKGARDAQPNYEMPVMPPSQAQPPTERTTEQVPASEFSAPTSIPEATVHNDDRTTVPERDNASLHDEFDEYDPEERLESSTTNYTFASADALGIGNPYGTQQLHSDLEIATDNDVTTPTRSVAIENQIPSLAVVPPTPGQGDIDDQMESNLPVEVAESSKSMQEHGMSMSSFIRGLQQPAEVAGPLDEDVLQQTSGEIPAYHVPNASEFEGRHPLANFAVVNGAPVFPGDSTPVNTFGTNSANSVGAIPSSHVNHAINPGAQDESVPRGPPGVSSPFQDTAAPSAAPIEGAPSQGADWGRVMAYWSSLSEQRKRQLEVEAGVPGEKQLTPQSAVTIPAEHLVEEDDELENAQDVVPAEGTRTLAAAPTVHHEFAEQTPLPPWPDQQYQQSMMNIHPAERPTAPAVVEEGIYMPERQMQTSSMTAPVQQKPRPTTLRQTSSTDRLTTRPQSVQASHTPPAKQRIRPASSAGYNPPVKPVLAPPTGTRVDPTTGRVMDRPKTTRINSGASAAPSVVPSVAPSARGGAPLKGVLKNANAYRPETSQSNLTRTFTHDSDSDDSFRRRRRTAATRANGGSRASMRTSMRSGPPRAPSAAQRQPPADRTFSPTPSNISMRTSMRNTMRSPNASQMSANRTPNPKVSYSAPPKAVNLGSGFDDSSDEEGPGPMRSFRSRFANDSDDEGTSPIKKVRIPMKLGGGSNKQRAPPGAITPMTSSNDNEGRFEKLKRVMSPPMVNGHPQGALLQSGTMRGSMEVGSPPRGNRSGLFGMGKKRKDSSDFDWGDADGAANGPARPVRMMSTMRQPHVEPQSPRPKSSHGNNNIFRRASIGGRSGAATPTGGLKLGGGNVHPFPPPAIPDQYKSLTTEDGGLTQAGLEAVQAAVQRQTGGTSSTGGGGGSKAEIYSNRTGKKKKFQGLRRVFGLND